MGMSIRCEGCGLVYAGGRGLAGLFASPRTSARPRFVRMLAEVARFQREARRYLAAGGDEQSLGDFLAAGRYSAYFQAHYILPVVSAVWSAGPATAREYPAQYLFRFLDNHGMLSRAVHRCSGERSRGVLDRYVERLAKEPERVNTCYPGPVGRIAIPTASRSETTPTRGTSSTRWSIATHADTALELLADPTPEERSVLGAFTYSVNETVLHTDSRLLPRQRPAQVSWNYLLPSCGADNRDVVVSYYMNRLPAPQGTRPTTW